jgi:hypothetical protein
LSRSTILQDAFVKCKPFRQKPLESFGKNLSNPNQNGKQKQKNNRATSFPISGTATAPDCTADSGEPVRK